MGDLKQLTPELENKISNIEILPILVMGPESRDGVVEMIKEVKSMKSKIVEFFKDSKDHAYKAWKGIVANEKTFTDRLDAVEKNAKTSILKYDNEQEAIRRKEQLRLQAIADEEARRERERLEKHAAKLKTKEKQDALLEEAESIIAPVVQVDEPKKTEGVSRRRTWKARVTDITKIPREWMVVNEKALDSFAKSTKGAMPVPGVEFYEDSTLTVKA